MAIRMFKNTNYFVQNIEGQFEEDFNFISGPQWTKEELEKDQTLRIKLPPEDFK